MATATKEKTQDETKTDVVEKPATGQELMDPQTGEITEVTAQDEYDYGQDAGAGFDNQTGEDVSVPFLVLLQPGSPEVQGEDAVAKAGMWINKTTGDVYSGKEGITFIPAYTDHLLVEWKPRDAGGGLVDQHAIDSDLARRVRAEQPLGAYKHPDMHSDDPNKVNDLVETFYAYGVFIDPTGFASPAVISFSSTHIKPYRDWMFRVRSIVIPIVRDGNVVGKLTSRQLPLWALSYQLRSLKQEKNGFTWYVPAIGFAGKDASDSRVPPGSEMYEAAKGVYEGVSSGKVKAATETLTREKTDDAPRRGDTSAKDAPY